MNTEIFRPEQKGNERNSKKKKIEQRKEQLEKS